jgi:archaellum component FlaF (FlaF/FlaG flagellin family)
LRSKSYRRRGISTVVTSVMLVSAVSLMGAFMVSWSSSNFTVQKLNIARAVDERVNQISESYIVEDVWFFSNATNSYAKVTLRNTGDVAAKITHVYVNNTQAWSGSKLLTHEGILSITFQSSWGAGKSQDVWVKTERGSEIKQVWRS